MSLERGGGLEIFLAIMALLPYPIEIDLGVFDREACSVAADFDFACAERVDTALRAHEVFEKFSGRASRNERVIRGSLVCLRYTEVAPILGKSLTYLTVRMIPHSGYRMERSTG